MSDEDAKAVGFEAVLDRIGIACPAIWEGLGEIDARFFLAVFANFELFDLVDVDRELIREEITVVQARWADTVGDELAVLDDPEAIEDGLAELLGCD